jgi:predicted transcriptional regulator of viral defense system
LLAWVAIDARQSQDGTIKRHLHRSRRGAIIMSSRLPALILIAAPFSSRSSRYNCAQFTLKHVKPDKMFGTNSLWRGRTKISVSGVHRTIIDILDDPAIGAGSEHVADSVNNYLQVPIATIVS